MSVAATANQDTKKLFKRVKLRGKKKLDWAIFKIDKKTKEIVPDLTSEDEKEKKGIDGLVKNLNDLQPRYAVFDYEFKTKDGRLTSKLYFIGFTPENANQVDRVVYAQALKPFRDSLHGIFPASFSEKNEILKQFGGTPEPEDDEDEDEDFD
uniref:ADF-H domain-containing protein n=1 Tax=Lotharella globosa TaxID=91324 RepID=A0A7S3ZFY8_9EUKA